MSRYLVHVVGARPNFMKIAPVMAAIASDYPQVEQRLIHTGQHYDEKMSQVFFRELGLPKPDVDLGVGSGSHAEQTGRIMTALERVFDERRPDLLLVPGDVNSTLAAALVAAKACIPIAHLEAGLRSFDPTMPEEVNRIVTDRLAQVLLTPSEDADENLRREGAPPERIERVGNVMVDTLLRHARSARERDAVRRFGQTPGRYALVTMHRPGNVDSKDALVQHVATLQRVARLLPVVLPLHPRTRKQLEEFHLLEALSNASDVTLLEPLGYMDFLSLMVHARVVLTDSGGVQEETTALSIPCLTMRESTERPITVSVGSNTLVGFDQSATLNAVERVLAGTYAVGRVPELWDGHAGQRTAARLARELRTAP